MNEDDLKLTITQNWLFIDWNRYCKQIEKFFNCQADLDHYLTAFENNLFLQTWLSNGRMKIFLR